MPNIGDGSDFVALLPGALEALVNNVRNGFAAATHTHGTSGIEDGAVTAAKLSADAVAALGVKASDLYDLLYDDATGATGTISLSKSVTGYNATAYKRIVIYYWSTAGSQGTKYYASTTVEMTSTVSYSERNVALCISMCSGSTYYQYFPTARLSGSQITVYSEYQFAINGSSNKVTVTSASSSADMKVHITRVEGWKVRAMDVFAIVQSASATLLAAAILGVARYLKGSLTGISGKLDAIGEATQATMRATLAHNYEKYATRGWLTPEERASWCDMYEKYEGLGANGYIRSYRARLDDLPDRTI